jgi:hypothetical protein
MTRKEAIARIKDHMSVHKIYEERAVKITEALNMAISALEQPEIIRCKDCKFYTAYDYTGKLMCKRIGKGMILPKPEDFCSYAERREE